MASGNRVASRRAALPSAAHLVLTKLRAARMVTTAARRGERARAPAQPQRQGSAEATRAPSLPVTLRRHQRMIHADLRALSTEIHVLHRLWYKGAAQFHRMVWWRPLRRVRVLGMRIAAGHLAGSVPLARSCAPPRASTDTGATLGVALLASTAAAYAALWEQRPPVPCEAYVL